ncbi:BMC domain-containing protein [Thaumasiovibrio sp. DFM-14]|uniref:BMC domain-containing protein n=1 Tax=Thaumasiovibrio sp. DFM-14 TaxID=3384792 RepID=UPI0039A38106
MRVSLGVIEVAGYALATIVADAMAKSSNIKLEKIIRTQGAGWMTIVLTGDIGSINSAIETGVDLASKLGGLKGSKVIARPNEEVAKLWLEPAPSVAPVTDVKPATNAVSKPKTATRTAAKSTANATSKAKAPSRATPKAKPSPKAIAKSKVEAKAAPQKTRSNDAATQKDSQLTLSMGGVAPAVVAVSSKAVTDKPALAPKKTAPKARANKKRATYGTPKDTKS